MFQILSHSHHHYCRVTTMTEHCGIKGVCMVGLCFKDSSVCVWVNNLNFNNQSTIKYVGHSHWIWKRTASWLLGSLAAFTNCFLGHLRSSQNAASHAASIVWDHISLEFKKGISLNIKSNLWHFRMCPYMNSWLNWIYLVFWNEILLHFLL